MDRYQKDTGNKKSVEGFGVYVVPAFEELSDPVEYVSEEGDLLDYADILSNNPKRMVYLMKKVLKKMKKGQL